MCEFSILFIKCDQLSTARLLHYNLYIYIAGAEFPLEMHNMHD